MPMIEHRQYINAPIELCFDLARDVDLHTQTTSKTKEKAVGGVTSGLLEEGDSVTWEAVHLGVRKKLTAKVILMEKPYRFVDVMVKGAFQSFDHTRLFIEEADGTIMIDQFNYKSPFGPIGVLVDKLFLEKYMKCFIVSRAEKLKEIAEKINSESN
ncbi:MULTISPECIES: SRPBCC family protein [unclassified Bacillus (in: firmicutes)]|uniref:SRPBCC family protein n=1 Tax=unclassified Bacillus (in: firmicutes) TaxID=185979 RepID=UPI0008E393D9|nr:MULTISPECIES: SRPBCC family protein [unclassified Bacillus (in: firmicutes)]SFA87094.1 Ligand-binding SRPBCC domain-containing protein [Bacillus sp. UNCCL13]SFQ84071.1 Ligand-binding SRPBCC domain-containing protein [Bacillus sp. cl95]